MPVEQAPRPANEVCRLVGTAGSEPGAKPRTEEQRGWARVKLTIKCQCIDRLRASWRRGTLSTLGAMLRRHLSGATCRFGSHLGCTQPAFGLHPNVRPTRPIVKDHHQRCSGCSDMDCLQPVHSARLQAAASTLHAGSRQPPRPPHSRLCPLPGRSMRKYRPVQWVP